MTFPLLTHREIDFVKKEEELKKSLDEKDKWYKEQLETLQRRVRAPPWTWGDGGGKITTRLCSSAERRETMT